MDDIRNNNSHDNQFNRTKKNQTIDEHEIDKKNEFTIKHALRITFLIIVINFVWSIPFWIIVFEKIPKEEWNAPSILHGSIHTLISLAILLIWTKRRLGLQAIGLTSSNLVKAIRIAIITVAIIVFIKLSACKFDIIRIPINLKRYFSHWYLTLYFILNISIRPFYEEVLFRGMWYGALRRKLRFLYASIIISFAFSIIHQYQHIGQYIWVFFFGIILVLMYEKTKNLYALIITHILYNLSVLLLMKPN